MGWESESHIGLRSHEQRTDINTQLTTFQTTTIAQVKWKRYWHTKPGTVVACKFHKRRDKYSYLQSQGQEQGVCFIPVYFGQYCLRYHTPWLKSSVVIFQALCVPHHFLLFAWQGHHAQIRPCPGDNGPVTVMPVSFPLLPHTLGQQCCSNTAWFVKAVNFGCQVHPEATNPALRLTRVCV